MTMEMYQTKQILINILDNAVKYTQEGAVTLSVVGEEYGNNEILLKNMHISPYEQGNIFNKDPLRDRKLLLHKKEILLKEHSHFTNSHIIIKRNAIHEWRNQTQ